MRTSIETHMDAPETLYETVFLLEGLLYSSALALSLWLLYL